MPEAKHESLFRDTVVLKQLGGVSCHNLMGLCDPNPLKHQVGGLLQESSSSQENSMHNVCCPSVVVPTVFLHFFFY